MANGLQKLMVTVAAMTSLASAAQTKSDTSPLPLRDNFVQASGDTIPKRYQNMAEVSQKLWHAKPDQDKAAKPYDPKIVASRDTLYWGDLDDKDAPTRYISSVLEDSRVTKKTHLTFKQDSQMFVMPMRDLQELYQDHVRTHHVIGKKIDDIDIELFPKNDFQMDHVTFEKSSTTGISAHMLRHFSLQTLKVLNRHETGHSADAETDMENRLHLKNDINVANEFNADDIMRRTSQHQDAVNALLSMAGYINEQADASSDPKRRQDFSLLRNTTFDFGDDWQPDHPSLGRRVQWQMALYQDSMSGITDRPALPPVQHYAPAHTIKN